MSNTTFIMVIVGLLVGFLVAHLASRSHRGWSTYIAWKIARQAKGKRDQALHLAREHLVSRIDSGESVEQATRIFKETVKAAHHDYEQTVRRAKELGRRLNGDHSEEEENA